jgi:hypothetical protein
MITLAQIHAAQNNDLAGITAVLAEMDDRIGRLAAQTASTMATNRARYSDYVEEFRQDASVTLFEYLPRWQGDSVDDFRAYLYSAIAGALKAKAHDQRNGGADRDAMSVFKAMVDQANGDVHEAERLAQTVPPKGKRLSADRAFAARVAWQGSTSLDKPLNNTESGMGKGGSPVTLADTLAVVDTAPEVIRPKVGRGAALEALAVLQTYTTAREVLGALPANAEAVDAIEETLTVPRDPQVRRYVLDAVAILRSYVSTAKDGDLIAELRTVDDELRDERAAKVENVHSALDKMGAGQREVLKYSFGIDGYLFYGWGDSADDQGLSEVLAMDIKTALRPARSRGLKAFAKFYIALVAKTEAMAVTLAEAATKNLARGGRK